MSHVRHAPSIAQHDTGVMIDAAATADTDVTRATAQGLCPPALTRRLMMRARRRHATILPSGEVGVDAGNRRHTSVPGGEGQVEAGAGAGMGMMKTGVVAATLTPLTAATVAAAMGCVASCVIRVVAALLGGWTPHAFSCACSLLLVMIFSAAGVCGGVVRGM